MAGALQKKNNAESTRVYSHEYPMNPHFRYYYGIFRNVHVLGYRDLLQLVLIFNHVKMII